MITQEKAIELAREVGAAYAFGALTFLGDELTAFANAVRKQTLLEAAEVFEADDRPIGASKLRRMAGVE